MVCRHIAGMRLLKQAGFHWSTTAELPAPYAAERNPGSTKPMPLFQLLVLHAGQQADIATAARAAWNCSVSGLRTPKAVLSAERQTMIVVHRAHGMTRAQPPGSPLSLTGSATSTR